MNDIGADLQRAFDEGYEKGRNERVQGNDLIRREDAINVAEEIETMLLKGQIDLTYAPTIKRLKSVPSADRPQGEWIPCSERLPKKDGRYQVTRHDDVTNTEFIDILWYEENLWWNRHSTGDYAVTAWMPLPKPWKGAER